MEFINNISAINRTYNNQATKPTQPANPFAGFNQGLFTNSQAGDTFEKSQNNNAEQSSNSNKGGFSALALNLLNEFKKIDNNVRIHENLHNSTAGSLGSSPVYEYKQGPDGKAYAVAGHVSIQMKKDADPNKTIRNADIVKRAALAPSDPSTQDKVVAFEADQMKQQAQAELSKKGTNKNSGQTGSNLNIAG